MKAEDKIIRWHDRVGMAKDSQAAWIQESGASRFIDMYNGKYDIFFHTRNKRIPVPPINEVFSYVQSDIAATYNRDPYITVNPKTGTVMGAHLWEVYLNYMWRELKNKEEIEYEIIDKDLVGYSWHKVGHTVESTGSGDAIKIDSEKFYSMRLDWKDVLWNDNSKRPPYDCNWMAQRIVWPLETIKRKFKNGSKVKGAVDPRYDKDTVSRIKNVDDIKLGVFYEIWDADEKMIHYVADGLENRYLDASKPWPKYLDEFPFLMYWDYHKPNSPRPMSAIAPWEHQILEEMIIMAQAINHAKRWNRQLFVRGGSIDEAALDKFERGDDGAVITVNAKMEDGSFKFADFGQLPTDFYMLMDRIQAIKRNIHGQPEFYRGGVTKTNTRTIGELQLMNVGAKSREDRRIDRLETHCENIARHLMAHKKANFDLEEFVKVTGEVPEEIIKALGDRYDPISKRVRFSPEEIKGEYDVEIKKGSTLPLNKENRVKVYESVLTALAPIASRGPISPFVNELIKGILQDYDVKALQQAYAMETNMVLRAKEEEGRRRDVEQEKIVAEADKRAAQAEKIRKESQLVSQEAAIGPYGRTLMKRAERPTNGTQEEPEIDVEKELLEGDE